MKNVSDPRQSLQRGLSLAPNSVFAEVRDYSGSLLGYETIPHDGTEDGIRKAANKLRNETLEDKYAEWSNVNTRTGATDESGRPAFAISPNGKNISPVGSDQAAATMGDENAINRVYAKG